MKTAALLDGNWMVRRAYHVTEDLCDPDGNPTGGVFGLLSSIKTTIQTLTPDRLIVFFDGGIDTWRLARFPEYKNRAETDPEKEEERQRHKKAVSWQIGQLTEHVLPLTGIPFVKLSGAEADDLIYLARRVMVAKGYHTTIVSGDKDFYQLVDKNTDIYNPMDKAKGLSILTGTPTLNIKNFERETGLHPEQWLDMRAMTGDTSDRIPGIRGVGEFTAIKVLREYGSIRNLLNRSQEVKKKGKRMVALIDGAKILARNLVLMGLHFRPVQDEELKWVRKIALGMPLAPNPKALKEYCMSAQALEFAANLPEVLRYLQEQQARTLMIRVGQEVSA